jgi:hypothetical protein
MIPRGEGIAGIIPAAGQYGALHAGTPEEVMVPVKGLMEDSSYLLGQRGSKGNFNPDIIHFSKASRFCFSVLGDCILMAFLKASGKHPGREARDLWRPCSGISCSTFMAIPGTLTTLTSVRDFDHRRGSM